MTNLVGPQFSDAETRVFLVNRKRDLYQLLGKNRNDKRSVSILNCTEMCFDFSAEDDPSIYSVADFVDDNRSAFIEDYRDLMGRLGEKMDGRQWWATNIASKNRFNAGISKILWQAEAVVSFISKCRGDLIIFGAAESLPELVSRTCVAQGKSYFGPRPATKVRLLGERFLVATLCIKRAIHLMYRLTLVKICFSRNYKEEGGPTVVLKSFFYESTIGEDRLFHDPMFGRLPEYLTREKKLIIAVHIVGKFRACLIRMRLHEKFDIVPVEYWLSPTAIIKATSVVLLGRLDLRIPDKLIYRGTNIACVFKQELFRRCNDIQLEDYLFYDLMEGCITAAGQVTHYIQTYENNPWEKMAILAVRRASPSTKISAFQHAVAPPAAVNLFNSAKEARLMPLPDWVVCSGKESVEIIRAHCVALHPVLTLGGAIRYEHLRGFKKKTRVAIRRILIAAEGVFEVIPMLKYVLEQIGGHTKYQLTFRFHPALPYEKFNREHGFSVGNFANSTVSAQSLQRDLEDHDLCIYWGSTVAIEALYVGMPLIHFDLEGELSYDPLFRCKHLKKVATKKSSLIELICDIERLRTTEYEHEVIQGRQYARNYFASVTNRSFEVFLNPRVGLVASNIHQKKTIN